MKSFFRQIPRPPLIIVIILLTSAVLLVVQLRMDSFGAAMSLPSKPVIAHPKPFGYPADRRPSPHRGNNPFPNPHKRRAPLSPPTLLNPRRSRPTSSPEELMAVTTRFWRSRLRNPPPNTQEYAIANFKKPSSSWKLPKKRTTNPPAGPPAHDKLSMTLSWT